ASALEDEQTTQDVEWKVEEVIANDLAPADGIVDRVGERRHRPVQAGVVPGRRGDVVWPGEDGRNVLQTLDQGVLEYHPAVVENGSVVESIGIDERGDQSHHTAWARAEDAEHRCQRRAGGAG